jgi:hypothetical protein
MYAFIIVSREVIILSCSYVSFIVLSRSRVNHASRSDQTKALTAWRGTDQMLNWHESPCRGDIEGKDSKASSWTPLATRGWTKWGFYLSAGPKYGKQWPARIYARLLELTREIGIWGADAHVIISVVFFCLNSVGRMSCQTLGHTDTKNARVWSWTGRDQMFNLTRILRGVFDGRNIKFSVYSFGLLDATHIVGV